MVPKIYHLHNFPLFSQLFKKVELRLSEHVNVIETLEVILYLCDMHNNEVLPP